MIGALLLGVEGFPATGSPLIDQLRDAGITHVDAVDGTPGSALDGPGPVLVVRADLVAHTAVLRNLATEPGGRTTVLIGARGDSPPGDPGGVGGGLAVREERGQIVGVGGDAVLLGAVRVAPADLPLLAAAGADERPLDRLLADLVATGARVGRQRAGRLYAATAVDQADAERRRAERDAIDEDAARLRMAVKEHDDFFTTYFISTWSPWVTKACARLRLTPAAVTGLSVALAALATVGFATGLRGGLVAGAALLYLSFVLDCVDGQLARYTREFSPFGGWLDTMADRGKEYLVYAGLAFGAERVGATGVWPLAVAALVLQTVRHQTDYWYGALHDEAARRPGGDVGGALGRMSQRVQSGTGSPAYWLKRIVVFPIGERWALIAVTAALFDGRVALLAVLTWGAFAGAYTLALRSMRARSMRVPVMTTVDLPYHRDEPWSMRRGVSHPAIQRLGPLPWVAVAVASAGGALLAAGGMAPAGTASLAVLVALLLVGVGRLPLRHPHDGPLDWLVPAGLRAAELLAVVAVGAVADVPWPVVYGLLASLALRYYDAMARAEKGAPTVPRARWDVPWHVRVFAVAVASVTPVALPLLVLLSTYVVVVFCWGVYRGWLGYASPA
ncbi:CDP-alcohol phosphatidyltransferase family protein [Pilimelia columellifera]|uniref:DUF5941 domain-containing protein n=1 Tax=Pilimelia columellifera subsp. columellifera TaxID=706583 RepID=A0ABN3MZ40_9ACTN